MKNPPIVNPAQFPSRLWRWLVVATLIFVGLRALVQAAFFLGAFESEEATTLTVATPIDMQIYLEAAQNFVDRQPLYESGQLIHVEFFQYTPAYAFVFIPFLWLPDWGVILFHSILHIAAYALLYVIWRRLFNLLRLPEAVASLQSWLPLWLVYQVFWGDWAYLNIYILMAVCGSLLIESVLNERLGWATVWLVIILQIKPQWAFAAVIPLLLGRYRFVLKLMLLSAVGYISVIIGLMLVASPAYTWQQYLTYYQFLADLVNNFPWRDSTASFLGYNHSVMQTVLYWFGVSPTTMVWATLLKVLLLIPLALVSFQQLRQPHGEPGITAPRLALDLAFAFYLGAFIWLDWVWELSLGLVVFIYLLATVAQPAVRRGLSLLFIPYALLDIWQLVSVLIFGFEVIDENSNILTDPSIYFPYTLVIILGFYFVLLSRLWPRRGLANPSPVD